MSLCAITVSAAQVFIQGFVGDVITKSPLQGVTVTVGRGSVSTTTDEMGMFAVECHKGDTLLVEAAGYQEQHIVVKGTEPVMLKIELLPLNVDLDEVVVNAGKYSKKDNPAVELAKKLIARRDMGKLETLGYYSRTRWRRLAYGLNDFTAKPDNNLLNRYQFLGNYVDTVAISHEEHMVLPVSVSQSQVEQSYDKSSGHHEQVLTNSHAGLDENFDIEGIQAFLSKMICDVDIFQNDVPFMNNRFVSPLSTIGTTYYKYFLGDTVTVDGERCVMLTFTPFTPQAMGFNGTLYVTADTALFIKRVELSLPHDINLNFIGDMTLSQDFDRSQQGARLPIGEELMVVFEVFKKAQTLYAHQSTYYNNYRFDSGMVHDDVASAGMLLHDVDDVQSMINELRSNKRFFWSEFAIKAMAQGYVPTASSAAHSVFDIGPLWSLFSSNKLEGFRTRIGGRTTANLSPHVFLNGYVAMGWKDHKLKYGISVTYSFTAKRQFLDEYPVRSLTLRHQYDTHLLGHDFLYSQDDNVLFAISRAPDDKRLYRRLTMLSYNRDISRSLSAGISISHNVFEPTAFVPFVDGTGATFPNYKSWSIAVNLRYSPGEKFLLSYEGRSQVTQDAPIFTISHTFTPRSARLGSLMSNRTEIGVQKRFWLSAAGYVDLTLKAAKQWNKVHYLDLLIPNANLTYNIQPESYSLLNVMEFINDQQLAWDVTYWLNGAIFNRVPVLKKLKLREVVSWRGLWGSLRKENDPALNDELMMLPPNVVYQPMGKKPYMEMGVGIDNIFRILRIDYVWRLTYRDTPGVDRHGVRFQLHFSF